MRKEQTQEYFDKRSAAMAAAPPAPVSSLLGCARMQFKTSRAIWR